MKTIALLIPGLLSAVLFLISACGGGQEAPTPAPPEPTAPAGGTGGGMGDVISLGQAIFTGSGGCGGCHTIDGVSEGEVGPDLTNIGSNAASRKAGMSAEGYIEESIRDPEAFVAEGVERAVPGIMVNAITSSLTDEQVAALVDFLAGQK